MLSEIGSNFWVTPEDIEKHSGLSTPEIFGHTGSDYVWMSTGRSATSLVLDTIERRNPNVNKIAIIPPFTCHTVIEPFMAKGYQIHTYHIDRDLTAKEEDLLNIIKRYDAGVLLIHRYFGIDTIKDFDTIADILKKIGVTIIEDCTQCLYSSFKKSDADFFVGSIRKWCGVPDGGFAVCKEGNFIEKPFLSDKELEKAKKEASLLKYEYLFKGKGNKQQFLTRYREAEDILDSQDKYYTISELSSNIQSNLNVHELILRRKENYQIISEGLSSVKGITIIAEKLADNEVPLYCPILCDNRQEIQKLLAENSIYAPIVWPKAECCPIIDEDSEYIYNHILCIPIDQRYGRDDMQRILSVLRGNKKIKKIAIIGGGVQAEYFGDACHRIGFEGHYFSMADGKVDESKVDYYHEINIFNKDGIVDICRRIGIDGVVATTELSVPITAYVAEKLGLLGNPVEVAEVITDKYRNRECIKGLKDLLSPQYVEAKSIEDIRRAHIPYPIILKPVCMGGKRGITVVNNESELESAFAYAAGCFRQGVEPKIIAEQFLNGGMECSVESVSFKGQHTIVQITQKDSSGAPHCVELGHHQPAPLSAEVWAKVVKGVSSGLTAIGLQNGACHTEIKVIDGKVYLIEFNARPGGDHIWWPMVELSTGFDIMGALAQAAVGELKPIDVSSFKHNYSGLYYVVKQTAHIKPIFDTCEKEPWCWEKNFITDDLYELKQNDMEHTNYIIYTSEDGDPVEKLLNKQTMQAIKTGWMTWEEIFPFKEQLIDMELKLMKDYHYSDWNIPRSYPESRVNGLKEYLDDGNTFFWGAVSGDVLIGYSWGYVTTFIDKKRWVRRSLYFREEYRSMGFGSKAMKATIEKACELGCDDMSTEYVPQNEKMANLLRKNGFKVSRIEVVKKLNNDKNI